MDGIIDGSWMILAYAAEAKRYSWIHENEKQLTVYEIEVKPPGQHSWVVKKRYSEFESLYNQLIRKGRNNAALSQFKFPKKGGIFGTETPELLEERLKAFDELSKILLAPSMDELPSEVAEFFAISAQYYSKGEGNGIISDQPSPDGNQSEQNRLSANELQTLLEETSSILGTSQYSEVPQTIRNLLIDLELLKTENASFLAKQKDDVQSSQLVEENQIFSDKVKNLEQSNASLLKKINSLQNEKETLQDQMQGPLPSQEEKERIEVQERLQVQKWKVDMRTKDAELEDMHWKYNEQQTRTTKLQEDLMKLQQKFEQQLSVEAQSELARLQSDLADMTQKYEDQKMVSKKKDLALVEERAKHEEFRKAAELLKEEYHQAMQQQNSAEDEDLARVAQQLKAAGLGVEDLLRMNHLKSPETSLYSSFMVHSTVAPPPPSSNDPKVSRLCAMGFETSAVEEALKTHNGDENAAANALVNTYSI
mmetsp:Transcript_14924/g.19582  ORF Transcript_14924/g.19582 Transcript_14924/m.19582 type:complete len:480 (+) Transcript_14924:144-1583(+)